MSSPYQLINWINSEKMKGCTEGQLINQLKRCGYNEEEINKALLYVRLKFHVQIFTHLPIYILILSFLSLLFLGWASGEFASALFIIAVLITSIFIMDFFDKRNMDLASWAFFTLMYFLITIGYILLFNIKSGFFVSITSLIFVLSLIFAIIIFFHKRKQVNFYLLVMILIMSFLITTSVLFLLYLLITYTVIVHLPSLSLFSILLFFLPLAYIAPPLVYLFYRKCLERINTPPL